VTKDNAEEHVHCAVEEAEPSHSCDFGVSWVLLDDWLYCFFPFNQGDAKLAGEDDHESVREEKVVVV